MFEALSLGVLGALLQELLPTISAYLDGSLLGSGTDTGVTGSGYQTIYNLGKTLDNLDIDNSQDFHDDFTDTNGTNLSSHNANYSYSGTLTIQNNAIAPTGSNQSVVISNNNFGCMSIDETDQTSNTSINIRVKNGGNDMYQLIWWSNQWQLQGYYGGTSHVITNGNYGPNGTHTFKLCANGSTISAYLDGSLLGSGTDTGVTGSGYQTIYNLGKTLDNLLPSY